MRKTGTLLAIVLAILVAAQMAWWALRAELYFCASGLDADRLLDIVGRWLEAPPGDWREAFVEAAREVCAAEDHLMRPRGR
jgi:hypothetical protein